MVKRMSGGGTGGREHATGRVLVKTIPRREHEEVARLLLELELLLDPR